MVVKVHLCLRLDPSFDPNSLAILSLLRSHDRIMSVQPSILYSHPDLTLSPKLYFLSSSLVCLFLSSPDCLASSLPVTSPIFSVPTSPPPSPPTSVSSSPMASLPPSPPSSASNPAPSPSPLPLPKIIDAIAHFGLRPEFAMFIHAILCPSIFFSVPVVGCEEEGEAVDGGGIEIGDGEEDKCGEGEGKAGGGVTEADRVDVEGVADDGVEKMREKEKDDRRRKKLF